MDLSSIGDTESWALLLGAALPWLVAVVNKPWWPRRAKSAVAVAASVIGGVLVCLSTGAFADGPGTVVGTVMLVLIASQAVYGRLFAGSQKRLEERTSQRRIETEPTSLDEGPTHPVEQVSHPSQSAADPVRSVNNVHQGRHRK